MTTLREAAQQALEALENCSSEYGHRCNRCDSEVDEGGKVASALRAALAQQDEPVEPVPAAVVATQSDVWRGYNGQWQAPGGPIKMVHLLRDLPTGTLLYLAPPQRLPLTEEEIEHIGMTHQSLRQVVRAVERAHGIKEQP